MGIDPKSSLFRQNEDLWDDGFIGGPTLSKTCMLLVKTKIGPSPIHGIGLFADEDISKGTVVWTFNSAIDKVLTDQEIKNLPIHVQEFIDIYSFSDKGKHILCGDFGMFVNHSDTPNLGSTLEDSFAARDIRKGEEITDDYKSYDEEI